MIEILLKGIETAKTELANMVTKLSELDKPLNQDVKDKTTDLSNELNLQNLDEPFAKNDGDSSDKLPSHYDFQHRIPDGEGRTPDISGNIPVLDERTPDISGNIPVIDERTPDISGNIPVIDERTPDISGNIPNIDERMPNLDGGLFENQIENPHFEYNKFEANDLIEQPRELVNLDSKLESSKFVEQVESNESRELTLDERNDIQGKTQWTDKQMDKCTMNSDGTVHYKTDNEHLEGTRHEKSNVLFEKKVVDINGVKVEVVVPNFDNVYEVKLPENLEKATDNRQFRECDKQLKEAVNSNSDLKESFNVDQLEQINNGDTPDGFTWHHDAETGKMKLVDFKTHSQTGHTGGKALWGGGSSHR